MTKIEIEDDGRKGRFLIYDDEDLAGELGFTWAGDDKFIIDHTEVDKAFGGKGFGKILVVEAVAFARERKVKILPLCPFAKGVFDTKKDWADVRF